MAKLRRSVRILRLASEIFGAVLCGFVGGDDLEELRDVAFGAEFVREPVLVVCQLFLADCNRVGALDGDLDVLVLFQRRAGAFPEGLPVLGGDDAVLVEEVLEAEDGRWAEALDGHLDDFARRLFNLLAHGLGFCVEAGEKMVCRDGLERLGGVFQRHGMVLLCGEVENDALVEVIEPLDDAESPGLVEEEGSGLEREKEVEAAE